MGTNSNNISMYVQDDGREEISTAEEVVLGTRQTFNAPAQG
jgi:hypothetical protein